MLELLLLLLLLLLLFSLLLLLSLLPPDPVKEFKPFFFFFLFFFFCFVVGTWEMKVSGLGSGFTAAAADADAFKKLSSMAFSTSLHILRYS